MKAFKFQEFDLAATPDWKLMLKRWAIVAGILILPALLALAYVTLRTMPFVGYLIIILACGYAPLLVWKTAPVARITKNFTVQFEAPRAVDAVLLKACLGKVAVFVLLAALVGLFLRRFI